MSARDSNLLEPSEPPGYRKKTSSHPGRILQSMVMDDIEWSVEKTARELGIPLQHLQDILDTKRPITPEVAVRIGALLGTSGRMWMNMQVSHDMCLAQKALRKEIPRISAAGEELTRKTDTEYPQAA